MAPDHPMTGIMISGRETRRRPVFSSLPLAP